jgi:hypothetical protein
VGQATVSRIIVSLSSDVHVPEGCLSVMETASESTTVTPTSDENRFLFGCFLLARKLEIL